MPSAFISYSRRDKEFVQRLHDALAAREFEVWVDFEDIPPSAQWLDEIRAGLLSSDGVVFVISPDSVASQVCRQELEHAAQQHKRIVPVMHRDPGSTPVPEIAAALNWVFLRDGDDFDAGIDALVTALETDLDHVRTHTRLGVEAERWTAGGRDRSRLLRGAQLTSDEAWLVGAADKEPQPTQVQREYLLASRQAATRRQRVLIGGVSLGLLVAIALGVVALIQRSSAISERNAARAATRAKQAQVLDTRAQLDDVNDDPQSAVQLAVQAAHVESGSITEKALRLALSQSYLRIRFPFPGADAPPDVLWSPDGTRLLVMSPGLSARIYRPGTDAAPITIPPPRVHHDEAWDGSGTRIIVGGEPTAVYDADTGRLIRRLPGVALMVALSSDGTRAAAVDELDVGHGVVIGVGRVFDVATGRQVASFRPAHPSLPACFAWAPNDSVIAECDLQSDGASTLDLWDPVTGKLVHSDASAEPIGTVAFSPDSTRYVWTTTNSPPNLHGSTATQETQIAAAAGKPGTFVYDTRSGARVISFPGGASAATFSPDGNEVAYATLGDDVGHVYNFESGLNEPLVGATATIGSISFSSRSTYAVTASDDGMARVYDASTGALLETLADGDVGAVSEASFGLGDTLIATSSADDTARVWVSPIARPTRQLPLGAALAPPTDVAFSSDGSRIIETGLPGTGEILGAQDLRTVARFAVPPGYRLAGAGASRNGRVIAALAFRVVDNRIAAGLVETFDARTGRRLATMTPPAGESLVSASIDYAGDRLVTIYAGGDAEEWDARTGRALARLRGTSPATLVAFAPNGSTVAILHTPPVPASVAETQDALGPVTIDLWDPRSGRLLHRITGPAYTFLSAGVAQFAPLAIAFSANSKAIALAGADQNIWLWSTATGKEIGQLAVPDGQFADSLAFSPNRQLLAAGTGAEAYVWQFNPKSIVQLPVFQHADPSQFTLAPLPGEPRGGVLVGFTSDSRTLVTAGDNELEAWNIAGHLQIFVTFIGPYGRGLLDPNGTELAVGAGSQLSVFPCNLCGGTGQLLAVAKRYVTTVGLGPSGRATYLDAG